MTNSKANILFLLRAREVSVCKKRYSSRGECTTDADAELRAWTEADFLRRCSATYCKFQSSPRSTIATAFSCDGGCLASTHGDHTVKIVDCQSGSCKKVLTGHRRTPWVVSFHPKDSNLLASGSLDHEVRLWNLSDSACVRVHDFGRPIASLAFHSSGAAICVASGHKLHLWEYLKREPMVILKTRRSLRAAHYHPQGQPLLLTAELMDPNPPNLLTHSVATAATSDSSALENQFQTSDDPQARQWELMFAAATAAAAAVATGAGSASQLRSQSHHLLELANRNRQRQVAFNHVAAVDAPTDAASHSLSQAQLPAVGMATPDADTSSSGSGLTDTATWRSAPLEATSPPGSDTQHNMQPHHEQRERHSTGSESRGLLTPAVPMSSSTDTVQYSDPPVATELPPSMLRIGWELPAQFLPPIGSASTSRMPAVDQNPTAAAAVAGAVAAWNIIGQEQPCRVKLRLWRYDPQRPNQPLDDVRLTISDAVLCSEMGVHFSPCGRYLAACVACQAPTISCSSTGDQGDDGSSVQPAVYEIRVYSIEAATMGQVLRARRVRAAHCLTSLQFSPTSEHLLLSYGRRHISLLRSLMVDGGTIIPVHTILEVYRVADMALVRVMPSAEDEVNAACFHPVEAGGIAYGTKEGRLRLIRYDRCPARPVKCSASRTWRSLEDELMEADTTAECSSDEDSM